jgi:polyhydroxybutyrate depolymerase
MTLMRSLASIALVLAGAVLVGSSACGGGDGGSGESATGADGGGPGSEGGGGGPGSEGGAAVDGSAQDPPPVPSPGCGPANAPTGLLSGETITVGSETRTYELFVPPSYDGKRAFPLVFVFHGDGGTGAGIRSQFDLEAASQQGAIFVYPDGVGQTWRFDDAAGLAKDVPFVDQLISKLGKSHCTDTKRRFAVGFSRGAYFANQLGCFSTSGLRGVVAHAGGGPFGVDGSGTTFPNGQLLCPQPPTAALQVIGTNDDVAEAQKARDHWQRVNACASSTSPYAPSPCVAYDGCAPDRDEIYCEIPGLGHTIWSRGAEVTWGFIRSK